MKIKTKYKQAILIIGIATIVVITFLLPIIFLKIQDQHLYTNNHPREPIKSKIDPQIEDVYIINAIHQLYNYENNYNYSVVSSEESWLVDSQDTKKQVASVEEKEDAPIVALEELKKIQNSGIISDTVLNKTRQINTYFITQKTDNQNTYLYRNFSLLGEEKKTEERENIIADYGYSNITLDMKTYKILTFQRKKEDFNQQIEEEALLRAYTVYLGLEFLDDWSYTEGQLISEKAQLVIQFKEYIGGRKNEEMAVLDIRPIEYLQFLETID